MRGGYMIVDVDTDRPVRASRFTAETVVRALYQRIADSPYRDFKILDERLAPVSARQVVARMWAAEEGVVNLGWQSAVGVVGEVNTPLVATAGALGTGPAPATQKTNGRTGGFSSGPASPK